MISPCVSVAMANPAERPINRLNNGPAKHAAMAIAGCPSRATVTSATMSPTLLPHASTVAPNNVSLTP